MDGDKPAYTIDCRGKPGVPTDVEKVLISVEHASDRLPPPYQWSESDLELFEGEGSHWTHDPGAKDFATELAEELGCSAVFSNYTRLLIDPNRPLAADTLIRKETNTAVIDLNANLHRDDVDWRIARYYVPYHQEFGLAATACDASFLFSVHSFTREYYAGEVREFELGMLTTSKQCPVALSLQSSLQSSGFDVRLNQPWSGKDGFMFAADSVKGSASPGARTACMMEGRNDLMMDHAWRRKAVAATADAIREMLVQQQQQKQKQQAEH